MKTRVFSRLG